MKFYMINETNNTYTPFSAQNVFNDLIDLDGKILKGIKEPQDIGLLTLYEYYKVFEVGRIIILRKTRKFRKTINFLFHTVTQKIYQII